MAVVAIADVLTVIAKKKPVALRVILAANN
jgi:hypothetical protein